MTPDRLDLAFDLIDDARYEESLAEIDEVLAEDAHDAGVRALRAWILLTLQRPDEAADAIARARREAPEEPFVQLVAGEVALARGEVLEAIAAASEAQALAPGDADCAILEARTRAAVGQWPEVRRIAERVLANEPDHEGAAIVAALATQFDTPTAPLDATTWAALADRFPLNSITRTGRAWSLLETGKVKGARDEFEQALALDPGLGWAKHGLVLYE